MKDAIRVAPWFTKRIALVTAEELGFVVNSTVARFFASA